MNTQLESAPTIEGLAPAQVSLLGPSGFGKTATLSLIAGQQRLGITSVYATPDQEEALETIDVLGYRHPHRQEGAPVGDVTVMVRPEAIRFAEEDEPGVECTFRSAAYLGPVTEYLLQVGDTDVFASISSGGPVRVERGDTVRIRFAEVGVSLLPSSERP